MGQKIGLSKTKNWSGRNEVIETSGGLHPLWSQDKRLHTPRTADYRHTRQDRWIYIYIAPIYREIWETKKFVLQRINKQMAIEHNNFSLNIKSARSKRAAVLIFLWRCVRWSFVCFFLCSTKCLFPIFHDILELIYIYIYIIISNLSNDRSKASSKTIPPHSAI